MSWRTPDREPYGYERDDSLRLHGTTSPDRTDQDVLYDDALEQADRIAEKAPLAYVERPSDRERQAHRQEAKARRDTRPTGGHVTPIARTGRCTCGAHETGYRHPGHLYRCPRYAPRPERNVA